MATDTREFHVSKEQNAPESNQPDLWVGSLNVGNNTTCAVFAPFKETGKTGKKIELKTQSWIYEHYGAVESCYGVASNSRTGVSFTYKYGHEDYTGRTFVCGSNAFTSKGAVGASLIGDSPDAKVLLGLPMTLFSIASQIDSATVKIVLIASVHNPAFSEPVKSVLQGTHTIELLTRTPQGQIEKEQRTIQIVPSVLGEGKGGLLAMSNFGRNKDAAAGICLTEGTLNVLVDGGGGTFDVLLFSGKSQVGNAVSVPIGGNDITNLLLNDPELLGLFPTGIRPDRKMLENGIKNRTWSYRKGTVDVNFSAVGRRIVESQFSAWRSGIEQVTVGRNSEIAQHALIGGLMLTAYKGDPDNPDETLREPWNLTELFKTQFVDRDFIVADDPQLVDVRGSFALAELHAKKYYGAV